RLAAHKDVKEAVVMARTGKRDEKYLCAYIVLTGKQQGAGTGSPIEIDEYLSQELPDYMIPSYIIPLEGIPLTPNGKVDTKALPEPAVETGAENERPRNETEEKVAAIWAEVLGIEKESIGINSDFFKMGGHSLKATVMAARIHKAFDTILPLSEIFTAPTVREMARKIQTTPGDETRYTPIPTAEKRTNYYLSPAQKRQYILSTMETDSIAYNMPSILTLEGDIQEEKLEETFKHLVQRHESFRTTFRMEAEEPVQEIHEEVEFKVEKIDITT
ncbi:MAG: hypothetical protein GY757_28525, partial [bacterium]|nr:hypothetical protein [bacterium]